MIVEWVFLLTIFMSPNGEYGGDIELEGRAKTEHGCGLMQSAARKQLAQYLVQHSMTKCKLREKKVSYEN